MPLVVLLPAGSETSCSLNTVSAGLEDSMKIGRFGVEGCQSQGRQRLEGGVRTGCPQPFSPPLLDLLFTGIRTRVMS